MEVRVRVEVFSMLSGWCSQLFGSTQELTVQHDFVMFFPGLTSVELVLSVASTVAVPSSCIPCHGQGCSLETQVNSSHTVWRVGVWAEASVSLSLQPPPLYLSKNENNV